MIELEAFQLPPAVIEEWKQAFVEYNRLVRQATEAMTQLHFVLVPDPTPLKSYTNEQFNQWLFERRP